MEAASELGAPLQAVALLLLLSVLYELYVTPVATTHPVETWWWGVYVLAAPLLFGGVRPAAVHPLLSLFATRFAIEILSVAKGHWTVAVGRGGRAISQPSAVPMSFGLPVLPD